MRGVQMPGYIPAVSRMLWCFGIYLLPSPLIAQHVHDRIRLTLNDRAELAQIAALGIDLHCGMRVLSRSPDFVVEVDVSKREQALLMDAGRVFTMVMEDLETYYQDQAQSALPAARLALAHEKSAYRSIGYSACHQSTIPVPEYFVLGEMGGFLYYEEILRQLDSMHLLYPQLITRKKPLSEEMTTHHGNDVFWVNISDHSDAESHKPEVLFTGLTHAREPVSAMSLLFFMWHLLENYETDQVIRQIVDQTQLYFIPVVNPDGYIINETSFPLGGGMWRKNASDNDGDGAFSIYKDGVDLNRNFGYQWGYNDIGSSASPSSFTYRGTAPFSEPETQMLREFVTKRNFVAAFHNHAFGHQLVYPWEYEAKENEEHTLYAAMTERLTAHSRYEFGPTYDLLYELNGGANDWFFGERNEKRKIYSWIPEIGLHGFWPNPLLIVDLCREYTETAIQLVKMAGQHAEVLDLTSSILTNSTTQLSLAIQRTGLTDGPLTINVFPDLPHFTVNPSMAILEDMDLLEIREIHFDLALREELLAGTPVNFVITVEGKAGERNRQTVTYTYYPEQIFHDDFEYGMEYWTSATWGIEEGDAWSGQRYMTDSPGKPYSLPNTYLTLAEPLDLSTADWAIAEYYARWDIRSRYDFVQLQVKTPGQGWIPLCGIHTKPGSPHGIDHPIVGEQPAGHPIYDGHQPQWVREQIDLSSWAGIDGLELRFWLHMAPSGPMQQYAGFALDDFAIYTSPQTHCLDGIANADEEDVDCGGMHCVPCPTCADGILNGEEEGIDCGGPLCDPCPTCSDGIQNGDEEGVDCGGAKCAP